MVIPLGDGFAIRYHVGGVRYYQPTNATSAAEAEQELEDVFDDVRRGRWSPPAPAAPAPVTQTDPTLHEFASEWLAVRRARVKPRTAEHLQWALQKHLLPHFHKHRLSEITAAEVVRYQNAKLGQRDRTLSNRSINSTLAVLRQILTAAKKAGHITGENPARLEGDDRLRAEKPRRSWLELHEVTKLLAAAGDDHRPLLAVMCLAGLRVSEACALKWAAIDLANGRLHVADSKTAAGRRTIEMIPMLRDELAAWKARTAVDTDRDTLLFTTRGGTQRTRANVRTNVLAPAVERANVALEAAGHLPIVGLTNHSLRRTFCALLFEAGASTGYVMQAMGHTSASMSLEVYNRLMARDRDTATRVDALLRGPSQPNSANGGADATFEASVTELLDADKPAP